MENMNIMKIIWLLYTNNVPIYLTIFRDFTNIHEFIYLSNFSLDNDLVLITEDIRMTIRSISNITGKITVDEILGEIFSNFCIGK